MLVESPCPNVASVNMTKHIVNATFILLNAHNRVDAPLQINHKGGSLSHHPDGPLSK